MQIKIERSELQKSLQLVQGIVERKTTMPILSNVLFEAKGKKLITTATDLEVGVVGTFPAEVAEEGRVTIHARGLFDIVRQLPDETVQLKVGKNNWVEISCGKSQFKIMGLAPDEFPALPKKGEGQAFTLDRGTVAQMIDKTAFSMSSDETRYNLNGIFLELAEDNGKKSLRMVATDGHRLSIIDRELKGDASLPKGVILPRKGVAELKRLLETDAGEFELWVDGKHAIASVGNVTLIVRLIDGQFPPYRQVLPKQSPRTLSIDRKALLSALKRVSVLTSERTRGVKLSLSPKNLEISSSNPDFGEAREELSADYRGESFDVGFNARYVIDAVSSVDDDQAVLQMGDDTAPCVLRSEFDKGFTHLIMPMRL